MLTINDILDQIEGFQGEVCIRQWDYERNDYSFDQTLDSIDGDRPIRYKPIKYMYADTKQPEWPWHEPVPVLYIEVEDEE